MPSVKQDHSAHSGDRRSSIHSRASPKSRRGLPAVRIWSRRFRLTWVKKIMLLNYYFFNLRHSALLVLTVNDNEMTLDQIRSAKLQHVSTATTHRLLLRNAASVGGVRLTPGCPCTFAANGIYPTRGLEILVARVTSQEHRGIF